jgi:hypothetical protein
MGESTENPSIDDLVRAGLADGMLWILEAGPVWVGFGTHKPCVVCRLRIVAPQIQYDLAGPRGTCPAHAACYRKWRRHSDKLRKRKAKPE